MQNESIKLDKETMDAINAIANELCVKEGYDPKNIKIIYHNPQEVSNTENLNNIEVQEPDSIQMNTPAVTFENFNVYTLNGVTSVDPTTYNKFLGVNNHILQNIKAPESQSAKEVFLNTIANVTCSHITAIADNFLATISNIYDVFIARLNQSLTTENGEVVFQFQFKPHYDCFPVRAFESGLNSYLNANLDGRNEIINQYIASFAASYINMVGVSIYTDTRSQVSQLISDKESDNNSITEFFNYIDSKFSLMMMDMNYEVAVFAQNLATANPYIPLSSNIQKMITE